MLQELLVSELHWQQRNIEADLLLLELQLASS